MDERIKNLKIFFIRFETAEVVGDISFFLSNLEESQFKVFIHEMM